MHSSAACAMNTYSLLHVAQLRETLPGVAHMSFKCSTLGHSTCCHSCCRPWLGTQTIWPSGPVTQFHMFEDTIAPVCLPYAHHTPHTSDLGCACCSLARRCSATPLYVFDASGAGGGRGIRTGWGSASMGHAQLKTEHSASSPSRPWGPPQHPSSESSDKRKHPTDDFAETDVFALNLCSKMQIPSGTPLLPRRHQHGRPTATATCSPHTTYARDLRRPAQVTDPGRVEQTARVGCGGSCRGPISHSGWRFLRWRCRY